MNINFQTFGVIYIGLKLFIQWDSSTTPVHPQSNSFPVVFEKLGSFPHLTKCFCFYFFAEGGYCKQMSEKVIRYLWFICLYAYLWCAPLIWVVMPPFVLCLYACYTCWISLWYVIGSVEDAKCYIKIMANRATKSNI